MSLQLVLSHRFKKELSQNGVLPVKRTIKNVKIHKCLSFLTAGISMRR